MSYEIGLPLSLFNVLSHITVPLSTTLLDLEGDATLLMFTPLSTVVNLVK